ncbi:MAG TPA: PEP-CTERM sorting domain-containing protein [Pyrinomonadaceae bacterium]|nr:PEP-CTERM sorting domain-containing protein [Pyrinomonadaceae bacterium]
MRIQPLRLFLLPALLLVLLAVPAYADPVTITFTPPGPTGFYTSYTEQGFNFSGNMFIFSYGPGNFDLENNSSQATRPNTIRINFGGGTFDFLGADLLLTYGQSNVFRASNGAELVFGQSSLGFVDAQGLFDGITWLDWVHTGSFGESGPNPAGMDNFRFNAYPNTIPTPEPATLLLLGSGLLGALKFARRRRGD